MTTSSGAFRGDTWTTTFKARLRGPGGLGPELSLTPDACTNGLSVRLDATERRRDGAPEPHSPDPRQELDMSGYGIVKVPRRAPTEPLGWEPKAPFAEVARSYSGDAAARIDVPQNDRLAGHLADHR